MTDKRHPRRARAARRRGVAPVAKHILIVPPEADLAAVLAIANG